MHSLYARFAATAARFPGRPAVNIGARSWTYTELLNDATRVGAALQLAASDDAPGNPVSAVHGTPGAALVGVLGNQSYEAYRGVLGVLGRGHAYVPLNPQFPAAALVQMLEASGADNLYATTDGLPRLDAMLAAVTRPIGVVLPPGVRALQYSAQYPQHRYVELDALDAAICHSPPPVPEVAPEAPAMILFTSGSTGIPKGVGIANRGIEHYLQFVCARYGIAQHDRCSQLFPLNFDMSAFDMFVAWSGGACVCAPAAAQSVALGRFIDDARLTVWFSTPSAIALLRRQDDLAPGAYPRLRWAFFAGEAFPLDFARDFLAAAPNATIENLYGPTELTLTCTWYRYDPARTPQESEGGGVPIGYANPGMQMLVADDALREVPPGEVGELLMAGPQMTLGYCNDREKTRRSFIVPPGREELYYRTGDRVRRPHAAEPLNYLGRGDAQVQIHGVRVELGSVEAAVRAHAQCDSVALGWPLSDAGADGVVLFMIGAADSWPQLRRQLQRELPPAAVPKRAFFVDAFPTTSSGKIDRRALLARLAAIDTERPPATTTALAATTATTATTAAAKGAARQLE